MKNFIKAAVIGSLWAAGTSYAVDGVKLITHSDALAGNVTPGDASGYPVTISRRGSYRLASSLRVPDGNTHGVQITTDDVTLDLNGFAIQGPGVNGSGMGVHAVRVAEVGRWNIALHNGMIGGMGSNGVMVGAGSHVENLRIEGNKGGGIVITGVADACVVSNNTIFNNFGSGIFTLGTSCVVTNNAVSANVGIGIYAGEGSMVKGNTVFSNALDGVIALDGSLVVGNSIRKNSGFGLSAAADVGYRENTFTLNNGEGAGPQVNGGIQIGPNLCGLSACP